jgi:FkbM family methyltransferase
MFSIGRKLKNKFSKPRQIEIALREIALREDALYFIDIGANRGDFIDLALSLPATTSITAFEPIPALYKRLQRKYQHRTEVHIRNEAVSSKTGPKNFDLNIARPELSSFEKLTASAKESYQVSDIESFDVQCIRLDSLLENQEQKPIFLKIDAQGHDYEILKSLSRRVALSIRYILCEVPINPIYEDSVSWIDYLSLLHSLGFEPLAFEKVASNQEGRLIEADIVFRNISL